MKVSTLERLKMFVLGTMVTQVVFKNESINYRCSVRECDYEDDDNLVNISCLHCESLRCSFGKGHNVPYQIIITCSGGVEFYFQSSTSNDFNILPSFYIRRIKQNYAGVIWPEWFNEDRNITVSETAMFPKDNCLSYNQAKALGACEEGLNFLDSVCLENNHDFRYEIEFLFEECVKAEKFSYIDWCIGVLDLPKAKYASLRSPKSPLRKPEKNMEE